MIWGCISAGGFRDPLKNDGIMNMEKYHQTDSGFIFYYGDDPGHTASALKPYPGRKTHNKTISFMD